MWIVVRVHKDKAFKALDMLAEGRTVREIAKEVGLSFTQLKELREVLPLYVEVRELEEKLRDIREDYLSKLRELQELEDEKKRLQDEVDSLRRERHRLQQEIEPLRAERDRLENEIDRVLNEGITDFHKGLLGVLDRLKLYKMVIDECLGILKDVTEGDWLVHEIYLPLYRKIVRIGDKVVSVEDVKPGYTCVRDDSREVFDKVREIIRNLWRSLEYMSGRLSEAISRTEAGLQKIRM